MTHPIGRRALLQAAALLGAAGLAACAALAPRSVEVSKARLQESLARRFPITRRVGEGIDLTVEAPRLELLPETNRFALAAAITSASGLFGRPLAGELGLSSGLVFDAATGSVRASDVRVDRVHVEGLPPAFERGLERLLRPLAAAWLEQQPIYVLRERDVERLRAAGVVPSTIRIGPEAVSIDLVPR